MEWITVEEFEQNLADFDSDGFTGSMLVYVPRYNEILVAYFESTGIWYEGVGDEEVTAQITHVMPLPEPPHSDPA